MGSCGCFWGYGSIKGGRCLNAKLAIAHLFAIYHNISPVYAPKKCVEMQTPPHDLTYCLYEKETATPSPSSDVQATQPTPLSMPGIPYPTHLPSPPYCIGRYFFIPSNTIKINAELGADLSTVTPQPL